MAKYNLSDLLKDEWSKGEDASSGQLVQNFVQNRDLSKHWIEIYPKKTKHYYRYVWRERGRLHHKHIGGGNVDNPRAIALMEKVERAIRSGENSSAIVKLLSRSSD